MTTTTPPNGTIGVTPTFGPWYDRFVARGIQWVTSTRDQYGKFHDAKVNHAVVFVGDIDGRDGPQLVQAQPGGAAFDRWDAYGDAMIWLTDIDEAGTGIPIAPTTIQQSQIVEFAKDCAIKKIGYNYLDFLAIALAQQRFGDVVSDSKPSWWAKRLANPKHLICSQLADAAYSFAGIQLFSDHRLSGLVSPADLLSLKA